MNILNKFELNNFQKEFIKLIKYDINNLLSIHNYKGEV